MIPLNEALSKMDVREWWLGISDGCVPHISDSQKWSTDYHLIEKKHLDQLIALMRERESRYAMALKACYEGLEGSFGTEFYESPLAKTLDEILSDEVRP